MSDEALLIGIPVFIALLIIGVILIHGMYGD